MELAVTAAGMVSSVGFNAPASLAAIRAGIRNVNQTNLWDAGSGEYLAAGRVLLPHWWTGLGKLAELVAPAIQECFKAAAPEVPRSIPVLLGLPDPARPFRHENLDERILSEISHRLDHGLHPASRVFSKDHVSIVQCLHAAEKLLADRSVRCCVIAGVDSLLQQDLARHYLGKRRLLTALNSNGFSPGEAGSAVLVVPSRGLTSDGLQILGAGLATEKSPIESEEPTHGDGLTNAIKDAFNDARMTIEDVHCRITDLNGEHYKFKEMVIAMNRLERKPKPKLFDLWHPIEFIGDVGAAIGPIVLAVALDAGRKGYAVGPGTLCTFGNDNGERAAVITRFQAGGSHR